MIRILKATYFLRFVWSQLGTEKVTGQASGKKVDSHQDLGPNSCPTINKFYDFWISHFTLFRASMSFLSVK